MSLEILAIITVFLPLIAAIVVGMNTKNLKPGFSQIITSISVIISAICSSILFYYVIFDHRIIHFKIFQWFNFGSLKAWWGVYVDSLTVVMFVVVTFVSSIVHVYSIGYMEKDSYKQRFMAYLALFTFFMLLLVSADNFLQLFVGWEGVGLSSFLLIGFWFKKSSATSAAMKAFLVNRVGDIALAIGVFLLFLTFDSVEYSNIFSSVQTISVNDASIINYICLLLFIGCMGKSAQIILHVWLPDAMEGPTPVSALIHAATMVTAGVFLVVRCSPIFEYASIALIVVTVVGAITCIFAASIALVQNDIKKIIAYSTCSQLGYMFFACGVSAYSVAIFHLATHAFFKALLFLGAGSVIHSLHEEQDIRKMGGLWNKIPYTYTLMWIGSLALAGIFPFSGFYSKDLILESAYASGHVVGYFAYWVGLIAAVFTAFYSWRLLFITFHGKPKFSIQKMGKIHDAPISMAVPMLLLAIGAVFSGIIGEKCFKMVSPSGIFWNGAIFVSMKNNVLDTIHELSSFVIVLPLFAGVIGVIVAFVFYFKKTNIAKSFADNFSFFYNLLVNKYYFDEVYNKVLVNPIKSFGKILWKRADDGLVDGMPRSSVFLVSHIAKFCSYLQTGYIYHYAMVMVIGVIFFVYWMLFS